MKKLFHFAAIGCMAGMLASCGSTQVFMEAYAPEENGLNLVKITDETSNTVLAGTTFHPGGYAATGSYGVCMARKFAWNPHNLLEVSPDGTQLAYCARMNGQDNVMVRSIGAQGMTTQRTFRNVLNFSWGADGKLYFADMTNASSYICCISASQGNLMDQLTNGSVIDKDPVVSHDGKMLFFTRNGSKGPSIWSQNRENGTLTSCAMGYNPCLVKDNPNAFYCVRNSTAGRSEIWFVDFVNGKESLILSDENRSFTNPKLSPDGKWLVCVGNSVSSISKKDNLDIFVVKTDGSRLTQMTYHPANDCSPAWAADGRSIFFISGRANEKSFNNVWRMNFTLD